MKHILLLVCLLLTCPAGAAQQLISQRGRPTDNLLVRPDLQQLVEWQAKRAADSLIAQLNSNDAAVRARAAFALGSVQSQAAQAPLIGLLNDIDPTVRADAAFAIGQLPDSILVAPLLQSFSEEHDVRAARMMLYALGQKGDRSSLAAIAEMDVPPELQATRALAIGRYALRGVHHPMAVRRLLADLASADPQVRLNAAYYFGRSRSTEAWAAAAGAVRSRLSTLAPDDPAAMHLVLGLGRLGNPDFTWPLLRWMRAATDWRTRVNAARALAPFAEQSMVQTALITTARAAPYHVALAAAGALAGAAEWNDSTSVYARRLVVEYPRFPQLTGALLLGLARHGMDSTVTAVVAEWMQNNHDGLNYAFQALAYVESERALELLAGAATSPDDAVAFAAYQALIQRRQEAAEPAAVANAYYSLFSQGMNSDNVAVLYVLAPQLSDSLFLARGSLELMAATYRRLEAPAYLEPMAALLGAMGSTGDDAALPIIEHALEHPHPAIRRAAAAAYENLTGEIPTAEPSPSPIRTEIDWNYLSDLGPAPRLVLETERGRIVLAIDVEEAPVTAQTILRLAESGAYDSIPFHRAVSNFVIQGGDVARANGFGGPGFTIPSEFSRIFYRRGALGMASAGKDTEGSQFFITHSMQPHLDGRYTAFGFVIEGMDVVDAMREGDLILEARVEPSP